MRVLLLGPPGSGKGTHGPRIAERYGARYLSTGELLRGHIREGSELGRAAQPYVERGDLVPDELVLEMFISLLKGPEFASGYVLDGFPRTLRQASAAEEATAADGGAADVVVFLDVPQDALLRRLEERARQAGRADDQVRETVRHRMREYEEKTRPLLDFYHERGLLAPIDAAPPTDEVTDSVFAVLDDVAPW